jgi:hypothetical protein
MWESRIEIMKSLSKTAASLLGCLAVPIAKHAANTTLLPDGVVVSENVGHSRSEGEILSTLGQPDDKVIVGGRFHRCQGVPRSGLARVNADGSLDAPVSLQDKSARQVYSRFYRAVRQ